MQDTPKDTPETIHYLHIGKTAGTQISYLSRQLNNMQDGFRIKKAKHQVALRKLPNSDRYFFSIRNPETRFFSGFYSRKRKGQPRIYSEWRPGEKRAFGHFEHATDLAEALFADGERGEMAFAAMHSITHIYAFQSSWFTPRGFFLKTHPPVYIIRQEHLERDWGQFAARLGVETPPEPTKNAVKSHQNDYDNIPPLSQKAKDNLFAWYRSDFEFNKQCEAWIMAQDA